MSFESRAVAAHHGVIHIAYGPSQMKCQQLSPDVWLFTGDAYESAATAFLDGDDVFLVDALASVEDAMWMRGVIHDAGKRVTMIATTHFMSDHMAGLALFPDAVAIAHRFHRHTFLSQNSRVDAFYVEPKVIFDGAMELQWGRHRLRLMHNPGKTMDHISVDAPEADLVCAGDNIVGNIVYLSRADPRQIDSAIARIQQLGRKWVVSAHMGLFPSSTLHNARVYLARLRDATMALRRTHSPEEFAQRIMRMPIGNCLAVGVMPTAFEREWHGNNLTVIRDQSVFSLDAVEGDAAPYGGH